MIFPQSRVRTPSVASIVAFVKTEMNAGGLVVSRFAVMGWMVTAVSRRVVDVVIAHVDGERQRRTHRSSNGVS